MRTIPLEHWTLCDTAPGRDMPDDGAGWMPVTAPGDTYLALIAAGRLLHPFEGRHEADAAWVRTRTWWQRITIDAPVAATGERVELVFDGLDTFASIYMDGELIARTDNMFRRYAVDITDRIAPGARHAIAVRFDPPAAVVGDAPLPVWSAFKDRVSRSKRTLMRKAQFGWGWDWGPDLPTVGIWKAARIEIQSPARITGVSFATLDASDDSATCEIEVETAHASATMKLRITLHAPDGEIVFAQSGPAATTTLPIAIDNPQLWWTADLGAQPLYTLRATLQDGDRVLDELSQVVGLRTIHLDESPDPDEPGTNFFRFVLNGVPIFAKGACWVPSTSFVGVLDEATYRRLIAQAVGANMNMLRIWGGGIYEPDLFYDLCDRMGVLVWQDFMFACAQYPDDAAFAASVQAEIEDQIRRLRNHACLALWCGNNECQAMHRINADMSGDDAPMGGIALYETLMPGVLDRLDPMTPYRPSSPWGGPNPNSMRAGDVHDWTVWHGIPPIPDAEMEGAFQSTPEGIAYTRYAEDRSRFVSEFGIQAAPALATLKRWMDPADLHPDAAGFHQRIKDEARKAEAMMSRETGAPETLQDYVDYTQWIQAEGLKFGIEHFRRRRPHCSGALLWQLNDCWPCVSWSLIDYDGVQKAGWHAVRRAFAPVLASFRTEDDGSAELWITNDTLGAINANIQLSLETLGGRVLWRRALEVAVAGASHAVAWRGDGPRGTDQVLRVWSTSGAFGSNRLLPGPIAHMALPAGAPSVTITRIAPAELKVDLAAAAYLPFVHLVSARPDLRFSDNYFDLTAGERHTVMVTAAAPVGACDIAARSWTARSAR